MDRIVSTEEFWKAMGSWAFIRVSLHKGKIRGDTIRTATAPEEVEGFMNGKADEIINLLKPKPFRWFWQKKRTA